MFTLTHTFKYLPGFWWFQSELFNRFIPVTPPTLIVKKKTKLFVEFPSKTQKIILNTLVVANQFEVKFSLNQLYWGIVYVLYGFLGGSDGEESACSAGDLGLIPGLRRSPGEGNGNPLQYYCLENSMDRGTWWATIHEVTKSHTRLSN